MVVDNPRHLRPGILQLPDNPTETPGNPRPAAFALRPSAPILRAPSHNQLRNRPTASQDLQPSRSEQPSHRFQEQSEQVGRGEHSEGV